MPVAEIPHCLALLDRGEGNAVIALMAEDIDDVTLKPRVWEWRRIIKIRFRIKHGSRRRSSGGQPSHVQPVERICRLDRLQAVE
jgi:hypothetical protein